MTPREFDSVARKFRMEVSEGGNHRKAKLYYEGELIISTLRSRSPKEFEPHQVRRQLRLSGEQLNAAVSCTLDFPGYIEILRDKGLLGD